MEIFYADLANLGQLFLHYVPNSNDIYQKRYEKIKNLRPLYSINFHDRIYIIPHFQKRLSKYLDNHIPNLQIQSNQQQQQQENPIIYNIHLNYSTDVEAFDRVMQILLGFPTVEIPIEKALDIFLIINELGITSKDSSSPSLKVEFDDDVDKMFREFIVNHSTNDQCLKLAKLGIEYQKKDFIAFALLKLEWKSVIQTLAIHPELTPKQISYLFKVNHEIKQEHLSNSNNSDASAYKDLTALEILNLILNIPNIEDEQRIMWLEEFVPMNMINREDAKNPLIILYKLMNKIKKKEENAMIPKKYLDNLTLLLANDLIDLVIVDSDDIPMIAQTYGLETKFFDEIFLMKNLKELTLDCYEDNSLTDDVLKNLMQMIPKLTCLEKFRMDLSNTSMITDKGMKHFTSAISSLRYLSKLYLDLQDVPKITNNTLNFLSEAMLNLHFLTELHLDFLRTPEIDNNGLNAIKDMISKLNELSMLSLIFYCNSKITNDGLSILAKSLQLVSTSLSILRLDFGYNPNITDAGFKSLAESIKNLSNLTELELKFYNNSKITNDGMSCLANNIKNLLRLKNLYLDISGQNQIGDTSMKTLSESILVLPHITLITLDFKNCKKITQTGITILNETKQRLCNIGLPNNNVMIYY